MLLLAACAGDGSADPDRPVGEEEERQEAPDDRSDREEEPDPSAGPDEDDGTDDDPASEPDEQAQDDGDADAADGLERLPGEPTTERSEREGDWGEDLRIVEVRLGAHDGFDRVTFELAGDGEAGWWIEPQDDPVAQGSGHPLEVAGSTSLLVAVQPLPYPEDGELTTPDRVTAPDGATVLTEVVQDSLFEGQHRFAIGLDGPVAYVVERFDDPQRVVIDLVPRA